MSLEARIAEMRVALTLLTRLPAGRIAAPPSPAEAAWAFPLCGAVVGALGWLGYAAASACGLPPAIAALLAVTVMIVATGALHEDGLADFADGLGGPGRAASLAIMRDSRIGSFGALALVLAVGLRALAIAALGEGPGLLVAFVAVAAASRFAMLAAMAAMPPARQDGLGHGAGRPRAVVVMAGGLLACLCLAPLGQAAPAIAALVALAAALTGLLALRRLGGQTGDVLGAVQVVSEVAGWLALVAVAAV